MKRWLIMAGFFLLCGGMAAAQVFELKTWRDMSEKRISRMGRSVMSAARSPWIHAESTHFLYHSESMEELARVAQEAEFAHDRIGRALGLDAEEEKARIFICVSERIWNRVIRMAGNREEGIALHVGNEIYLYRPEDRAETNMDLAHEMVHYRIRRRFGMAVPLWLEEGLAVHLGWVTTRAYHETLGRALYREIPALEEEDLVDWDELFALPHYPSDPAATRSFYRLSSDLVERMMNRIEPRGFVRFIERMAANRREVREVLKEDFGWHEQEWQALLRDVRADALKERTLE